MNFNICFFFLPLCLFADSVVFTTAFNRPDFIELQYRLFEKFLEDDYQFWVICDGNTPEKCSSIQSVCDRLHIPCRHVPQEIHDRPYLTRSPGDNYNNPNVRHCNATQWAWDNFFSSHDGPVMLIDSDMFLIRPFSIEKTLENTHLAGIYWGTEDMITHEPKSYLWLGLILFNNRILPEKHTICFNCGWLPGTHAICDSGGWTHFYLAKHKNTLQVTSLSFVQGHEFFCPYRYTSESLQNFDHLSKEEIEKNLSDRGFTRAEIKLAQEKPYTIELIGDNHFLHYRAGSNYENYSEEFLSHKDKILMKFFNEILE